MTEAPAETYAQPLGFTEFEVMKAIPKGQIVMRTTEPGTWRHLNDRYAVTSTVRTLQSRGLVDTNTPYVEGVRIPQITQAGYAAMSRALRHPPKKRTRG